MSNWHQFVPKDPAANVRFRLKVYEKAASDPVFARGLREMCRQDILFWINLFVWQFNPREKRRGEVGPFITWGFQDRALLKVPGEPWDESDDRLDDAGLLWCIDNDEDALIEKSREMGASWLCLLVIVWRFLFKSYQAFLVISRSEEMVDSPKPQSLFWKVDFILDRMPHFIKGDVKRSKCYFGHSNHSTITGEASTGRAGVGGRFTAAFIDEASQIKEMWEVYNRTSDSTGCRIINGTHKGTGTCFHELATSVVARIKKLVLHWTEHPDKKPGSYFFDSVGGKVVVLDKQYSYPPDFDYVMSEMPAGGPHPGIRSPWYDRECLRKLDKRAVAEDLDIDAAGSASQFFDVIRIRALRAAFCMPPVWEGDVSYDARGRFLGLLPQKGGPLRLWRSPRPDGTMPPGRYGLGADVGTGCGATNSCLSAGDATTGEKILEYATCTMPPEKFALACCAIGWLLKTEQGEPALFCWENKGPGLILGKIVQDVGYPCLYWRQGKNANGRGEATKPGWDPGSGDAKRVLLDSYRVAIYSQRFINRSFEAMSAEEILQYRYNSAGNVEHPHDKDMEDPTGARVNHGDRVIGDALCQKMLDQLGRPEAEPGQMIIPLLSLAWRRQQVDNQERAGDLFG